MSRAIRLTMTGVAVLWVMLGCVSTQPEPPQLSASGYQVNVRVEPSRDIWLSPPVSNQPEDFHGFGVVFVEVTDAQGRLVDDVPVTFHLSPDWALQASLSRQEARTENGVAQVVFEPNTTGHARITAQVGELTREAVFNVNVREGPGSGSGGPFGGGMSAPRSSYY